MADPFLSKLQRQTEASYIELLANKGAADQTEEEEKEAAEIEVSNATCVL